MAQQANSQNRHKRIANLESKRSSFVALIMRARRLIASRLEQRSTRHSLSALNDHQLRDIGYTRDQLGSGPYRGVFDFPSQRYFDNGYKPSESTDRRHSRISRIRND